MGRPSFQTRLASKVRERANTKIGRRGDLVIGDYMPVNGRHGIVRLLVGYSKVVSKGEPTLEELERYVTRDFHAKAKLIQESVVYYPKQACLEIAIQSCEPVMPLSEFEKLGFTWIIPGVRAKEKTGDVWEVRKSEGEPHLIRHAEDDLIDLVEAKFNAQPYKGHLVKFEKVERTAGRLTAGTGDRVSYLYGGAQYHGTIKSVGEETFTIKSESAGTHTIDKQELLKVLEKSEAAKAEAKRMRKDYYTKAFGDPAYADALSDGDYGTEFDDIGPYGA